MDRPAPPVVTGLGVATALGFGKASLRAGLDEAPDVFGVLRRPGRDAPEGSAPFLGAELPELPDLGELLPPRRARTAGLAGRVALAVLAEAWDEAQLGEVPGERVGLVVGGSNLEARESLLTREACGDRLAFLRPRYGHTFLDSDVVGLCAEVFGIRGPTLSVGGASASGALAVWQAATLVRAGAVDACVALGALQDLSRYELQGLRSLGAMGPSREDVTPGEACRPFDAARDGFLFGEASAALVLRRAEDVPGGGYGSVAGGAHISAATRGPEPSAEAEARALRGALRDAGIAAEDVDYVSTHGTGSPRGDDAEVAALREVGLAHARVNATKSLVGHGLAAAGALETAALLLQLESGRLHPTRNLTDPIDPELRWVRDRPVEHPVRHALKLAAGFGGVHVALAVRAP